MQALGALVDWYFSLHNRVLFENFLSELVSAQSVLLALGAPFFDTRPLQMLSGVIKTHRVAVFLNLGARRQGFVAPGGTGPLLVDVAGIHEHVPRILKELRERYGVDRFDDSPLHRSIKLYADFVARARRHELDDHINEALLHYVIALELIFGERQAIQKSVAERVALITFHESGRSFEQQRQYIDSIYELRSRYVHAGTQITDVDVLDKLHVLCEQTFRCLLRLQAAYPQSAGRGEGALKGWLKELDYLSAGFIAGKQPDEKHLREAFILRELVNSASRCRRKADRGRKWLTIARGECLRSLDRSCALSRWGSSCARGVTVFRCVGAQRTTWSMARKIDQSLSIVLETALNPNRGNFLLKS